MVKVHVLGAGVVLLLVFPAAFVDVATEELLDKSATAQIRVFGAGVWHNLVLGGIARIGVSFLPFLLWPFYTSGDGMVVVGVKDNSGVAGPAGLSVGDIILSVQGRNISSAFDWSTSLSNIVVDGGGGLCLRKKILVKSVSKIGSKVCCV